MKYRNVAYFSMIFLLAVLCSGFDSCQEKVEEQVIGCWMDSYEENKPNSQEQIFRRCDYKTFPPSRFRFSLELKRDGICSYRELSPTDGHYMEDGTWRFEPSIKSIEIWDGQMVKIRTYKVIKFQKNQLVLEML